MGEWPLSGRASRSPGVSRAKAGGTGDRSQARSAWIAMQRAPSQRDGRTLADYPAYIGLSSKPRSVQSFNRPAGTEQFFS
jgi:hypothetical protein